MTPQQANQLFRAYFPRHRRITGMFEDEADYFAATEVDGPERDGYEFAFVRKNTPKLWTAAPTPDILNKIDAMTEIITVPPEFLREATPRAVIDAVADWPAFKEAMYRGFDIVARELHGRGFRPEDISQMLYLLDPPAALLQMKNGPWFEITPRPDGGVDVRRTG